MNPTEGAALKPLSGRQIRELVILARDAFMLEFPEPQEDFNEWRHRQCMMTVERAGLKECVNEDYLPLRAHFLRLCGRSEEAQKAQERYEIEPRTWALNKLHEECKAAEDVLPQAYKYAEGFIRNKRGVNLLEADDKTIWHAIFVIRRRAEQLRRKKGATA